MFTEKPCIPENDYKRVAAFNSWTPTEYITRKKRRDPTFFNKDECKQSRHVAIWATEITNCVQAFWKICSVCAFYTLEKSSLLSDTNLSDMHTSIFLISAPHVASGNAF